MQRASNWRFVGRLGALAFAPVLLFACGAESVPSPSGAPLVSPASSSRRGNLPPVVKRAVMNPARPIPGKRVQAVVSVEDPDGDPFRLRYRWSLDGRSVGEDRPSIVVPEEARGQRVELEVVATDGLAESVPVRVSARLANRRPLLQAVYLAPAEGARVGTRVTAKPEAMDVDGDPLRFQYSWTVNGEPVDSREPELDTSQLRRGDRLVARVVARDGYAQSLPLESPPVILGNSPPDVVSRPTGIGSDGVFRYTVESTDPDGDRNLRFRLQEGPAGLTVDSVVGEVVWRPTLEQTGVHPVEVRVEDGHGGLARHRFELSVRAEESAPAQPPASR